MSTAFCSIPTRYRPLVRFQSVSYTHLYSPLPEANGKFAPRRFIEDAEGLFIPHTEEEKKELMRQHCASITTDKVICYCVPCTKGIQLGGKQGIHLLDLILGNYEH